MSQYDPYGSRSAAATPTPTAQSTERDNLERLLRVIAYSAPQPWYPRLYARDTRVPLAELNHYLEQLWDEGLIHKIDNGNAETGAGLALTPTGSRLLMDPERLAQLLAGRTTNPTDRRGRVRAALRNPRQPIATYILIGLNVLVFLLGSQMREDASGRIIIPAGTTANARFKTGSIRYPDLVRGQWWRLLSCCFVHGGLLHLGVNMFSLYQLGRVMERLLGVWRFLIVYLLSGVGGSWFGVMFGAEIELVGASGAICGVLGAFGVWVLLNGRFLPAELARSWRTSLIINSILLAVMGFLLRDIVSNWGHLGGAVVGAVTMLLLFLHGEATAPLSWLGIAGLVLLPVVGYVVLRQGSRWEATQARETQRDEEREVERRRVEAARRQKDAVKDFNERFAPRVTQVATRGIDAYLDDCKPLTKQQAAVRKADQVTAGRADLARARPELVALIEEQEQAEPYEDAKVEASRQKGLEFVRAVLKLLDVADAYLRDGQNDDKELRRQEGGVSDLRKQWGRLK